MTSAGSITRVCGHWFAPRLSRSSPLPIPAVQRTHARPTTQPCPSSIKWRIAALLRKTRPLVTKAASTPASRLWLAHKAFRGCQVSPRYCDNPASISLVMALFMGLIKIPKCTSPSNRLSLRETVPENPVPANRNTRSERSTLAPSAVPSCAARRSSATSWACSLRRWLRDKRITDIQ